VWLFSFIILRINIGGLLFSFWQQKEKR